MRVGLDLTGLYVARAGVLAYDARLYRALLAQDRQNEYLLLDYEPARERDRHLPDVDDLRPHHGRWALCTGLRHRRLARWERLHGVWRTAAGLVDRTVLWPWSVAASLVQRRRVGRALHGVDVCHTSQVLLRRQPGALNVITLYDVTAHLFPRLHTPENVALQRRAFRFARRQADRVVVISQTTRRDVVTHLGVAEERVRVVAPGVGAPFRPVAGDELARALAPLGLAPGGYMLHVGTLEPRKNLERLVAAYAQLLRADTPLLVLAGAPGRGAEPLCARIEQLGLGERVRLLSSVPTDRLPALYSGASLFVYPSLYEGFGLPVLEAMACGAPVVASNAGALPEAAGGAGVLVDPLDVDGWAETLAALLADPDRRRALRAQGLAHAASCTWERAARALLAVYTEADG